MPVASTTQDAYNKRIEKLKTLTDAKVTNTRKMIKVVNEMDVTPGTRKNYFIALHSVTKGTKAGEKYKEQFMKNDEIAKKTPLPPPPDITYEQIQTVGLKIMNDEKISLEDRILVGLSTQINPLRLDYCKLPVNPKERKGNYILLNGPNDSQIVITEHKTSKVMLKLYGDPTLSRKLTPELHALIKQWHDANKDSLLLNISTNLLGKRLTRVFAKHSTLHVTQNVIRHAYVTMARKGDRQLAVVSKIAKDLGHSVTTNELYRYDNYGLGEASL